MALALLGCLALVLHGCTPVAEDPGPPVPATSAAGADDFLRYAATLGTLAPAELARRRQVLELAYARDRDPEQRLRLALLLREPRTPGHDPDRARHLLRQALHAPASTAPGLPWAGDLARFVLRIIEQQQAESASLRHAERSALEAEQRSAALESTALGLRDVLARERARREALERQVEELKAIELQINQRTRPDAVPESPAR